MIRRRSDFGHIRRPKEATTDDCAEYSAQDDPDWCQADAQSGDHCAGSGDAQSLQVIQQHQTDRTAPPNRHRHSLLRNDNGGRIFGQGQHRCSKCLRHTHQSRTPVESCWSHHSHSQDRKHASRIRSYRTAFPSACAKPATGKRLRVWDQQSSIGILERDPCLSQCSLSSVRHESYPFQCRAQSSVNRRRAVSASTFTLPSSFSARILLPSSCSVRRLRSIAWMREGGAVRTAS